MGALSLAVQNSMYPPTWEPQIAKIISKKVEENNTNDDKQPMMVGIVGMSGSGKTTSSQILLSILEQTYHITCTIIPMDGYHFSIAQLKSMGNSDDLIYRRGAPDTFDARSLRHDLEKIRKSEDNFVY